MKSVIEQYPEWESRLAPRIILGIWHVSLDPYTDSKKRTYAPAEIYPPSSCDPTLSPPIRNNNVYPRSPKLLFQTRPWILCSIRIPSFCCW